LDIPRYVRQLSEAVGHKLMSDGILGVRRTFTVLL
jgi:hypothetical protein